MAKSEVEGCRRARVVEVIETTSLVGRGVSPSPLREITQYWEKNGRLIAVGDVLIWECLKKVDAVLKGDGATDAERKELQDMLCEIATIHHGRWTA